jgi:hypothetical protein
MLAAQPFLHDFRRSPVACFGIRKPSQKAGRHSKIVQDVCDFRVIRPLGCLERSQGCPKPSLCLYKPGLMMKDRAQEVGCTSIGNALHSFVLRKAQRVHPALLGGLKISGLQVAPGLLECLLQVVGLCRAAGNRGG